MTYYMKLTIYMQTMKKFDTIITNNQDYISIDSRKNHNHKIFRVGRKF